MKILFVSQWYSPEPDGRVSALAEGLVERGHDVVVITGFPNYPYGKIYEGYCIKWRQWEEINGVRILRLPLFPDHSHSVIKRALNYLSFSLSLFLLAPWFIRKPDVIWSYTPFVALPTLWIHKLFRTPYIMEISDIWPDTIIDTGMLKGGFILHTMSLIASIAYKNSAAITVQNSGFKPYLIERGAKTENVIVVENWADEKIYKPVAYNEKLAEKYNLHGKFNVVFAGNIGLAQGVENIVAAAELCKKHSKLQFVFIGDGGCLLQAKNLVEEKGLRNVIFIDRKPAHKMPEFFAIADVLLVHLRDKPLFEITLPSKTQTYLACGRPILIAKRGVDAKLLENKGCALHCEPDNPEALAKSAIQLYKMKRDERNHMGQCGLDLYMTRYRKDVLLERMENVLMQASKF